MNELKKPNGKRMLAMLLTICMCLSLFPASRTGATEATEENEMQNEAALQETTESAEEEALQDDSELPGTQEEQLPTNNNETQPQPDPAVPDVPSDSDNVPKKCRVYFHYSSEFYYDEDSYDEENKTSTIVQKLNGTQMDMPAEYTVSKDGRRNIIGWSTERFGAGRESVDFDHLPVYESNSRLDLYPILDKYIITIRDDLFGMNADPIYADVGTIFSDALAAALTSPIEGITLDGWKIRGQGLDEDGWLDDNVPYELSDPISSDCTAYAQWGNYTPVYFCYPDDFHAANNIYYDTYVETVPLAPGQKVTQPTEFIHNEYRNITGWSLTPDGALPFDFDMLVDGLGTFLSLYPIVDRYRVKFNGGDYYTGSLYVDKGGTIDASQITINDEEGLFDGWYETGTAEDAVFDFSEPIDRDYSLSARVKTQHTVSFHYPDDLYFEKYYDEDDDDYYMTSIKYVHVISGKTVSAPTEHLENEYRKITGWTDQTGKAFDFSQPVSSDIDLYPVLDKCRVKFNDYEYDCYDKSVYVEKGKTIQEPVIDTSDVEDAFDYWYYYEYDENFDETEVRFDFKKPVSQDYELRIKWKKRYRVSFSFPSDFDDGSDDWYDKQYARVSEGDLIPKPQLPTDNGKRKILGWTKTEGSNEPFDFSKPLSLDDLDRYNELTLYPILDKYRVHFSSWDIRYTKDVYATAGETVTPPQDISRDHFTLDYWSEDYDTWEGTGSHFDFSTPIHKEYYLEAVWKKDFNFTIKLWDYDSENYNSSWNQNTKLCYVTNGTSYSDAVFSEQDYPQPERSGYIFSGWYYDKACTKECPKGSKFDQTYYQETNPWDADDAPNLTLYAGWKKTGTNEVTGYCNVELYSFRNGQPAYLRSYLVEKGTILNDLGFAVKAGKTERADGISYEISSPAYYADEAKQTVLNIQEPIQKDEKVYISCRYDFTIRCNLISYDGVTEYVENMTADHYYPSLLNLPVPKREGYIFTGWYLDSGCCLKYNAGTMFYSIRGRSALCAGWQKQLPGQTETDFNRPNINYYRLDFVYNDKAHRNNPEFDWVMVEQGQSAAYYKSKLGDPTIPGHYFAGWYLDEAGTIPFDFNMVPTKDTIVYAKWGTNPDGSIITPQNGSEVTPPSGGNGSSGSSNGSGTSTGDKKNEVTTVTLSETYAVIPKGSNITLKASTLPADAVNAAVSWRSSDKSVALVDQKGKVTAKKAGTATIYAKTANGREASCDIVVSEVKLNAKSAVLQVKKSSKAVQIATKYPSSDKVKSWRSSKPSLVKVDKKGKITAGKKVGSATITVTMKSGATASYKIKVQKGKVKTKSLKLNQKKLTIKLKKKKTIQLAAVRNPITATDKITWSSSNKKVASVDKKGRVKALKKGKTTITAKTANGKKATCKVVVK